MKLTFLGTGAGEGYPGLWCACPHCAYARSHGGRNVRANSCATIDGALILDMGPACFDNTARFGVDLTQAQALLVTHPHEDHLYPQHLMWRKTDEANLPLSYAEKLHKGGPRFTAVPEMTVFGGPDTKWLLSPLLPEFPSLRLRFCEIEAGQSFEAAGFRITPVQGNHGDHPGFAHSYIIEKNGRTMLYALDTGTYAPDMMALVEQFRYDLIVMEGTTGLNEQYGGHMCLVNNGKVRAALLKAGCIRQDTPFVLTHLSPHWCPPHDWYESIVAQEGMTLAYDGMQIEF